LNRRASKSRPEISIHDSPEADVPSPQSLEAEEDRRRAIDCYRRCVDELTEKQRVVLELYASGHNYRAISEELKVSESYVGVRLTEIRGKLRELLLKRCPDSVEMLTRSIKRRGPRVDS